MNTTTQVFETAMLAMMTIYCPWAWVLRPPQEQRK